MDLAMDDQRITYSDHLGTAYSRLYNVKHKWYQIGLLLGVHPDTLESIQTSCQYKSADCLLEMLKCRLQSGGPLTWRELCDCLKSRTVARNDVAEEIEALLIPATSSKKDSYLNYIGKISFAPVYHPRKLSEELYLCTCTEHGLVETTLSEWFEKHPVGTRMFDQILETIMHSIDELSEGNAERADFLDLHDGNILLSKGDTKIADFGQAKSRPSSDDCGTSKKKDMIGDMEIFKQCFEPIINLQNKDIPNLKEMKELITKLQGGEEFPLTEEGLEDYMRLKTLILDGDDFLF